MNLFNLIFIPHRLRDIQRFPESLFFKNRPINIASGSASVDADYFIDPKVLSLTGNWISNKLGLSLTAFGNTRDKLTSLAISKRMMFGGNDGVVNADYNVKTKKFVGSGSVTVEKTTVTGTYLTSNQELVVAVSYDLDEDNTISPVFFSSSGKMQYSWSRKFVGGALDTTFVPGENVRLSWTDRSQYGDWHTHAEVPINTGVDIGKTKLSIKREWRY